MNLKEFGLKEELWREYDFDGRVYRIENPEKLVYYSGSTTHRVIDSHGVVHCVPAPGKNGCVLRWRNKQEFPPVQF